MASDKQIAANRRNAMRSTGPRTRSGKAHSRANSLRHGLLSKVLVDPALVNETDQLARWIAQEHGKPDDCFESRTIAEAELIILTARAVRAQLLDTTSSELAPDIKADDGGHSEEGSRGGKVASAGVLPTLSRIDKYERIAVWRRQRAVRKLCSAPPTGKCSAGRNVDCWPAAASDRAQ
jgi:hypothetical protein